MHLQLVLDSKGPFTNLDVISGRVQLHVYSNTTVSHITVKLEGESRTRLLAPPHPGRNDRPRPNLEIHKLLYKVATVFPPPDQINPVEPGIGPNFVLTPGSYTYPFYFKMPINNACLQNQTLSANLGFAGGMLEVAKPPAQHVKTTLPPSIYFPGEAEIRYYLKCTVNLPSFLKQNPRAFNAISFVPIEPPRPPQDGETYARRQHQFIPDTFSPMLGDRKGSTGSIFGKSRKGSLPESPSSPTAASKGPARFTVDARLPNPAILTCGGDVPLRLLVKQLSERNELLYLKTLQVELIGFTQVRAHDAVRTESSGWVLVSLANINRPIGTVADEIGTETEISKDFWAGQRLPDSVPPSFITCNISRKYELKVSVGLAYGGMHSRNQFIVLPLSISVEVFSGIRPPPELLKRTETYPPRRKPVPNETAAASAPSVTSGLPAQSAPGYEDAPPSYEDAIAETVPPVDGPRPGYRPPPDTGGEESRITDSKR
ncbi:uncharacterized protein PV09_06381 [Verruconis gallopava]|uniref:Arrestin-like N-terminal domain-containing protein n=1 Tax=Verruconis gallopava TaxID=253628 RepID=A0A0D1YNB5_9PEZI|nr:uncharacterized protein PV09_06381 [Verruconis gallopava]KIW02227.1 hypothetical protein PV09_06381 [Verruconis gallopava]